MARDEEKRLDAHFEHGLRRANKPHALRGAFKSTYAREAHGWTADVKVDFDNDRCKPREEAARKFAAQVRASSNELHAIRAYRTKKGFHLRVWLLREVSDQTRLHLQAVLGDDPKRQDFNASRVKKGIVGWNVLWTSKYENGRLVSREVYDAELTALFEKWMGFVWTTAPEHAIGYSEARTKTAERGTCP